MSKLRKKKPKYSLYTSDKTAWRRYQHKLKQKTAQKKALGRLPVYVLVFCICAVLIKAGFYLLEPGQGRPGTQSAAKETQIEKIGFADLKQLINPEDFINLKKSVIRKQIKGIDYGFHTSLDPKLQKSIIAMMDRRWSRHIGIVVMDPQTGRILAMASYNRNEQGENPCLSAAIPAASLFKIVSAAAAIETCGFDPDTKLSYNGRKYTLYRSQLEKKENKYTNHVTLEKAFAESVNPVFGKIGMHYLGKAILEKYAASFGFNRKIDFSLPLETSLAMVSDKSYNLAEIACGFNDTTLISPLHGAMLAAAIVNQGSMMKPFIIDRVSAKDQLVYQNKTEAFDRPIAPETARKLRVLMNASVVRGTASGSFEGGKSRTILENFDVGGKTGSINNNPEQVRFDWFAGYAEHKKTSRKIAVSVLIAHEKYIGTRAPEYFRKIVYQYFLNNIKTAGTS
ncbi:MAG: PbpA [Desulfobacteraceae bacterium]|nr:PbpA [Desulfobacteraceae bacterium]